MDETSPEVREWTDQLDAALQLLLEGSYLARNVGSDAWQFAVEIDDLAAAGMSKNAVRWLVQKGYARHAVETTPTVGPPGRRFRFVDNLVFPPTACLVLSDAGVRFALAVGRGDVEQTTRASTDTNVPRTGPHWDARARVLCFDGVVVKEFKVPAGNQELVLSAFEEEGWPGIIDDPLPPAAGIDAKRRLHDTINRLNRNQQRRMMHFSGNGSGRAVCWEPVASHAN